MKIIKRNFEIEDFTFDKIKNAINRAFSACNETISDDSLNRICGNLWAQIEVEAL